MKQKKEIALPHWFRYLVKMKKVIFLGLIVLLIHLTLSSQPIIVTNELSGQIKELVGERPTQCTTECQAPFGTGAVAEIISMKISRNFVSYYLTISILFLSLLIALSSSKFNLIQRLWLFVFIPSMGLFFGGSILVSTGLLLSHEIQFIINVETYLVWIEFAFFSIITILYYSKRLINRVLGGITITISGDTVKGGESQN